MHVAAEASANQELPPEFAPASSSVSSSVSSSRYAEYKVIRRNGAVVVFEPSKVSIAMTKAFLAVSGGQGAASARIRELVAQLTEQVVQALVRRQPNGGTFHIEDIQDQVELSLMRSRTRRGAPTCCTGKARRRAGAKAQAVASAQPS